MRQGSLSAILHIFFWTMATSADVEIGDLQCSFSHFLPLDIHFRRSNSWKVILTFRIIIVLCSVDNNSQQVPSNWKIQGNVNCSLFFDERFRDAGNRLSWSVCAQVVKQGKNPWVSLISGLCRSQHPHNLFPLIFCIFIYIFFSTLTILTGEKQQSESADSQRAQFADVHDVHGLRDDRAEIADERQTNCGKRRFDPSCIQQNTEKLESQSHTHKN